MFHAIKCTGEEVSLLTKRWEREELEKDRQKHKYFCPVCHEELILKLGYKQTWHFAHRKESSCETSVRGETELHHRAKLQIYEWLKKHGYNPLVEQYVRSIKQRPDILVEIGGKLIVFEVQQGSLQDVVFMRRSENYMQHHFEQRWIAINSSEDRIPSYFYPTKRLHSFIMNMNPELHSIFLHVHHKTWIIYKHFRYVSLQKILALPHYFSMRNSPTDLLSINQLIPTMKKSDFEKQYFSYWKKEVRRMRLKMYLSLTPTERFILHSFQQHFLNLNYFPSLCALPLIANIYFITSPIWWQSWLMLEYIQKTEVNKTISVSLAVNKLMKLVERGIFHVRPIMQQQKKDLIRKAVTEYFQALSLFSVIERRFVGVYVVKKQITIQKQIDVLMIDDEFVQNRMEAFWMKK